jgi:transcriptional regulator with XRE-family HTH domain
MSQQQLAQKAGLSRGFLSRLEVARQNPTLSTLEKIAKALKINLAKLVIWDSAERASRPVAIARRGTSSTACARTHEATCAPRLRPHRSCGASAI